MTATIAPTPSTSRRLRAVTCLLAVAMLTLWAETARAQTDSGATLTAQALIGDSVSNPDADRYKDVAEAIQRFANRDQLSARTFLERAVQKEPKLPPVGVLMAKLQLLSGNSAGVRPALEQAVQDDSMTDPEPYLLLAEEALAGGRTIEADALFDKAVNLIEAYDDNGRRKRLFEIRGYRGRAVIADRRKNWEQAEADLRKWIEQDPDDAGAYTRLGQVLFMRDQPTEGYQAFVKAKELNPDLTSPYVSAALMYDRRGEHDNAMSAFAKAFEQSPADETTLVAYAQALLKAGEMSKVESVLRQAREVAPASQSVWLLSGVTARMSGDPGQAEQHLMRAMSLSPSNRDVLNQLALVLIDSQDAADKKRALSFAQMNAQVNPNNPDVNISLAWVLFQNGRGKQATQALRQGLQGGSLSPDGSFLLAKMLMARNDTDNAKRLLESALKNEQGIFIKKDEAQTLLGTL